MDRRTFLSFSALAAAAPLVSAPGRADPAPLPASPSGRPRHLEGLAEAMKQARRVIAFDGQRFSGAGYEWLLSRGKDAQAFLIGEEHGIAENPKLAAQLFTALAPQGYRHVAVEISPAMAEAIDRTLRRGGAPALDRLLTTPESRVAFFGLKEEFEWLAAASAATRGAPFLWGLDYEVAADRFLIDQLGRTPKPAAAEAAVEQLRVASSESWARYAATRNPQFIYSFAGDPKTVQAVRAAWPNPDPASKLILDTLESTFAINGAWAAGKGYESNLLRTQFMRANFVRYWKRTRPGDRLFMKFGASHMVRGVSMSDVFDVGSLVPELVAERGGTSFHLLVLPGPGTQTANLDPTQFRYVPGNRNEYGEGMDLFDEAVVPGKFTLFDTAPLRPMASSANKDVPLPLWRVIHGFDAVLIMTGSTPSTNL
jgi:erythromycin esterase-like protein